MTANSKVLTCVPQSLCSWNFHVFVGGVNLQLNTSILPRMQRILHAILVVCVLAVVGCTRPSDTRLRADFQKAFGVPLPASFSIVLSDKTSSDFHGDYGLYAVLSLSREDFAALDRSLGNLPRVEKQEAIEVLSYSDVAPYFRSSSTIIQTQSAGCVSRCALIPEQNQIAFTVDYH